MNESEKQASQATWLARVHSRVERDDREDSAQVEHHSVGDSSTQPLVHTHRFSRFELSS